VNRASRSFSRSRWIASLLLLFSIALTGWWMLHLALTDATKATRRDAALNPGYQHSQRMEVACARAAMDVLGMTGAGNTAEADAYRADYRMQRMQIQADSLGLERWAAHDVRHQGLLLEIRGSLAGLLLALDQRTGTDAATASVPAVPLLPALTRAEKALSNYSASLTEPDNRTPAAGTLSSSPVLLWWLLILLLAETAGLAILLLTARSVPADGR
jgi:hypothetical protein